MPRSNSFDLKELMAASRRRDRRDNSDITAVLGPTNTGKTYAAIERMLGFESGIIGFPLRLLARENYERIAAIKGTNQVALITGEEKIVPRSARYWICTVEAMPLDRPVDFLAVDEIQLCGDPDRGHVFTDRLLNARGRLETMFLGAETIRNLMQIMLPGCQFVTRPRLSTLTYVAPKKVSRVPPRSAVVAFSVSEVYRFAEQLRQQRGGTAVVLGALSPRTRNAQVDMYQSGEVDYMVATDAIGMGLNMDLDHVTFGGLRKFDGRKPRGLNAQEIGQIAGRAGRHMNDGTFCIDAEIGDLDEVTVDAVQNHRYDPLEFLFWRNEELNFRSIQHLLRSLDEKPHRRELIRAREADDQVTLRGLLKDEEVAKIATSPASVRQLWDVCQVPDFRKTYTDAHSRLLRHIYLSLCKKGERINSLWAKRQVDRLDDAKGDIDTLVNRIANVRTWTYISNRNNWMDDPSYWQERTRDIENRLSDALHDRLTNQFVDRRAAMLSIRLRGGGDLSSAIDADGSVHVEGAYVGRLEGLHFTPDSSLTAIDAGPEAKPVLSAARRVLVPEVEQRVNQLLADNNGAFTLNEDGSLAWRGHRVGQLHADDTLYAPKMVMDVGDLVSAADVVRIETRVKDWLKAHMKNGLEPLNRWEGVDLSGSARAIAYQLWEAQGVLERYPLRDAIKQLTPEDRAALKKAGVRLGRRYVWLPAMNAPKPQRVLTILKRIQKPKAEIEPFGTVSIGRRNQPVSAKIDIIERALNALWVDEEDQDKIKAQTLKVVEDNEAVYQAIIHLPEAPSLKQIEQDARRKEKAMKAAEAKGDEKPVDSPAESAASPGEADAPSSDTSTDVTASTETVQTDKTEADDAKTVAAENAVAKVEAPASANAISDASEPDPASEGATAEASAVGDAKEAQTEAQPGKTAQPVNTPGNTKEAKKPAKPERRRRSNRSDYERAQAFRQAREDKGGPSKGKQSRSDKRPSNKGGPDQRDSGKPGGDKKRARPAKDNQKTQPPRHKKPEPKAPDPNSPFAVLASLKKS